MLERRRFQIDTIYVPTKRMKTLDADKVLTLAVDMLEHGQNTPIILRPDGERYVLVEGLHRLEAMRSLGEASIDGYLVRARLH